jgi:hypothetical protein
MACLKSTGSSALQVHVSLTGIADAAAAFTRIFCDEIIDAFFRIAAVPLKRRAIAFKDDRAPAVVHGHFVFSKKALQIGVGQIAQIGIPLPVFLITIRSEHIRKCNRTQIHIEVIGCDEFGGFGGSTTVDLVHHGE